MIITIPSIRRANTTMMSSSFDKETLEFIASWAERIAVWFAFISAGSALIFVIINRPLKKLEATERREAQQKFEELKARNLELEKSLAPRDFSSIDPANKEKFDAILGKMNALKGFAGTEVAMEVIPDFEARRAARYIVSEIEQKGWKIVSIKTEEENIRDGVVIWRHSVNPLTNPLGPKNPDAVRSEESANAIADCLKALGWQGVEIETGSIANISSPLYIPPNHVLIQVGFKPSSFFEPEVLKRMRKREDEIKNKIKNQ